MVCFGLCGSKKAPLVLSNETIAVLKQLFDKIDINHDNNITRSEALQFWGQRFAKVSADQMFGQTDEDTGGEISWEEFKKFWNAVLNAGYEESEILEEAKGILENKDSWRDWGRVSINKNQSDKS